MEDVNKQQQIFFSLLKLECGPQEIHFREIRLHLTFPAIWNKRDKVLKKREFILKVTFSLPSASSMLKLPINFCSTLTLTFLHSITKLSNLIGYQLP